MTFTRSAAAAIFVLTTTTFSILHAEEEHITIAVVGGTSFGYPPDFGKGLVANEGSFQIGTSAGTSPTIYRIRYREVPFYYVRMHGSDARRDGDSPGWYYVKTWAALQKLGVTHALGGATSGAINSGYDYGDLVIVDDIIVIQNQRPQNILRAAAIERPGAFANFAVPYCPDLRRLLIEEAKKSYSGRVHESGTFVQDDPGRFESPAEIRMMRTMGGDLVSHSVGTETVYARQLGMHFAALNSISNPAVGVRPFKFEDMQNAVQRISKGSVPIILETIARIGSLKHTCAYECIGEPYEGSYTNPDKKDG